MTATKIGLLFPTEVFLSILGPVQTVEFKGVSEYGADKYLVTRQSGQSQWYIRLADDGRIAGIAPLPVFYGLTLMPMRSRRARRAAECDSTKRRQLPWLRGTCDRYPF
jgi:hypothetical protein